MGDSMCPQRSAEPWDPSRENISRRNEQLCQELQKSQVSEMGELTSDAATRKSLVVLTREGNSDYAREEGKDEAGEKGDTGPTWGSPRGAWGQVQRVQGGDHGGSQGGGSSSVS